MKITDLKEISEAIAYNISIEKIYCLSLVENDTYHLIIIVPASCGTKFTELEPFVTMATNANKDITHAFYHTGEIREALKKGNLFFHLSCIESNLLYNKKDSPDLPRIKAENLLAWKDQGNGQFLDGTSKANAFLKGANFYSEKNETGLTVFMLHQFIELTYRALELAILAKEKRTHNIITHQSLLATIAPKLGVLFPADTPEEEEILKTLNNAYLSVRYEQNHRVNEAFLPALFHRAYLLQQRAETIISELNSLLDIKIREAEIFEKELVVNDQICENEQTNSKTNMGNIYINNVNYHSTINGKVEKLIDSDSTQGKACTSLIIKGNTKLPVKKNLKPELEKVIALIIEYLNPDQIYVFGSQVEQSTTVHLFNLKEPFESTDLHYDLLVISPLPNPYGSNIQSIVKSIHGVRTNLFIHSKEEAIKKLDNHNRFFHTVVKYGNLVYSKINLFNMEGYIRTVNQEIRDKTVASCTRRIFRSTAILKAVELIKDDVFEVTVFLLSQSLEQACLGLIYNFLGYSPNLHTLSHLMNICKMFWPENVECFPMETPDDEKFLAMLSKSQSQIRYTVGQSIEPEDLEEIYNRCRNFVLRSERIYLVTLSDLEIEEYQAVM